MATTTGQILSIESEFANELKKGCKQLSQLVAYMWMYDTFESMPPENKELFHTFDALLKYQAIHNNKRGSNALAALLAGQYSKELPPAYNDPDGNNLNDQQQQDLTNYVEAIFDSLSGVCYELGLGVTQTSETSKTIEITLKKTLKKVYEEVTGGQASPYVFTVEYLMLFYSEVSVTEFNGSVSYDFFGTDKSEAREKFLVVIPYPPKPALGSFTVTKEELKQWVQNSAQVYDPPNPYIPVNGST